MTEFDREITETTAWMSSPRFSGITRLHSPRQVVEQRGSLRVDYSVARNAAEAFFVILHELFEKRQSITTFGPYSPGQAVTMKRLGLEGIYLGGWATSAKGGVTEDPGADLACYPLSQVPEEASVIVRALLTADRNQRFMRSRMTAAEQTATPEIDYRPFIIADADTGHGGDAHVRNLVRRFVEAGVPGYHIEDQKPGVKKCGHQGGKVLVSQNEQLQRLNAARLQLDVMRVPGIIVSRTDAEAASLIDSNHDERDQPFILGATNLDVPSYKAIVVAVHAAFFQRGVEEIRGHLLFDVPEIERHEASEWLERSGILGLVQELLPAFTRGEITAETMLDVVIGRSADCWQTAAGLKTYRQAVADALKAGVTAGEKGVAALDAWLEFAKRASFTSARRRASALGIEVSWDCELAKTPEGYYQIQGGLEYAIEKSLGVAPFADLLWMETATANLAEAREYATAIHERFPDKMLAYNLSPSFNWDTTGMSEDDMRRFPQELAKLGFVFNFITYGGHQIDGLAAEEFVAALKDDGMLALARLQRKFRLLDSPYRTPQTLAGGPRLDAALMASSGRTATTKAMGKGSTQHQHLKETELSPQTLDRWIKECGVVPEVRSTLRPLRGGSEYLELLVSGRANHAHLRIVFVSLADRNGGSWLSITQQETSAATKTTRSVLVGLSWLFLIQRFKATAFQCLAPAADDFALATDIQTLGLFGDSLRSTSDLLAARLVPDRVTELMKQEQVGAYLGAQLSSATAVVP
jgi:isocitrate lyase